MRRILLGASIVTAGLVVTAAALVGTSAATRTANAKPVAYSVSSTVHRGGPVYLSLGDSLAVGVQPNAQGTSLPTSQGYADELYVSLRTVQRGLRLVKLGCPGETTGTLVNGGICGYSGGAETSYTSPAGSQLAAATTYLSAHPGQVSLVTVDIGANDLNPCLVLTDSTAVQACVEQAIPVAEQNLTSVLAGLRLAGYQGTIIGMTYYDPVLADWLTGTAGQQFAQASEPLLAAYNQALTSVYQRFGARIADVFTAFDTSDFSTQATLPGVGTVPANVARLCTWTWECAAPPVGPNEHANQAGYAVIARTFRAAYLTGRR
ncbi:MAG TPA: SGNH/GDSL hydrolase family protein [Streptosporangiaceae bacterium]